MECPIKPELSYFHQVKNSISLCVVVVYVWYICLYCHIKMKNLLARRSTPLSACAPVRVRWGIADASNAEDRASSTTKTLVSPKPSEISQVLDLVKLASTVRKLMVVDKFTMFNIRCCVATKKSYQKQKLHARSVFFFEEATNWLETWLSMDILSSPLKASLCRTWTNWTSWGSPPVDTLDASASGQRVHSASWMSSTAPGVNLRPWRSATSECFRSSS